jgi:hypothetical protein
MRLSAATRRLGCERMHVTAGDGWVNYEGEHDARGDDGSWHCCEVQKHGKLLRCSHGSLQRIVWRYLCKDAVLFYMKSIERMMTRMAFHSGKGCLLLCALRFGRSYDMHHTQSFGSVGAWTLLQMFTWSAPPCASLL